MARCSTYWVAPFGVCLKNFRDTILGFANYYPDFSLAAGGKQIYASSLMAPSAC